MAGNVVGELLTGLACYWFLRHYTHCKRQASSLNGILCQDNPKMLRGKQVRQRWTSRSRADAK